MFGALHLLGENDDGDWVVEPIQGRCSGVVWPQPGRLFPHHFQGINWTYADGHTKFGREEKAYEQDCNAWVLTK